MKNNTPRLLLLDSFALAFRVFYAFSHNPLINSRKEDISMVHGYWSLLLRILANHPPTHFAIVRDMGRTTFRTALYPDYKANRGDMPEEMARQLPWLEETLLASGLPVLGMEGFEADDLMASLARRAGEQGFEVWLATADKDMAQMVNSQIKLFQMDKSGEALLSGPAQIQDKFGVPPEKMRDYLALVGDTSDNIPGVFRVGPKTAVQLLEQFGSLDAIYANLEKVEKKTLRQNLEDGRENAFLSRELVTLQSEKDFGIALDSLIWKGIRRKDLHKQLSELELQSVLRLLAKIPDATQVETPENSLILSNTDTTNITTTQPCIILEWEGSQWDMLQKALQSQSSSPLAIFPLGRESLAVNDWWGVGLALPQGPGYYLVWEGNSNPWPGEMRLNWLKNVLQGRPLLAHDAKSLGFDILEAASSHLDLQLAAWLLDPGHSHYPLETLVSRYSGGNWQSLDNLLGKGKSRKSLHNLDLRESAQYAGAGSAWLQTLWFQLENELSLKNLREVYFNNVRPLIPCLLHMEKQGIYLNCTTLHELSLELNNRLLELEEQIHISAKRPFNISSPKQLSEILFVELGLSSGKKTSTGFSTAAESLEELRDTHPIIDLVLEYRELHKLLGTYVQSLPNLVNPTTGRLHTHFLQSGTATGRLSSHNPNLQNIPIRTSWGRRVRAAFCANSGHCIISADYSQIELRLLAHLSNDRTLCQAYQEGADIHARTAAALLGISEKEVNTEQRRQAKAVNFGVIYGMSAFRLARELKITRQEAARFIAGYFETYPGVSDFIAKIQQQAREKGFVETLTGRKRWLSGIDSHDPVQRAMAGRMAINSPIQGGAADIISLAMQKIHQGIIKQNLPLRMLLQVHDELVFECPEGEVAALKPWIQQTMEQSWHLSVPLVVEVGSGKNWLEAH